MRNRPVLLLLLLFSFTLTACNKPQPDTRLTLTSPQFAAAGWEEIVARARGTTVNYGMWSGDEGRNRYFQGAVTERLKQQYGITLRVVPNSDVAEAVNKILNEKGAGKTRDGSIDLIWINGENFRSAKQAAVLWGPFAEKLPNIRY